MTMTRTSRVPASVVPATFENGGKSGEIGVDICKRIDQRVTDTRLRCEVDDIKKPVFLEQCGDVSTVGKVKLHKAQAV